MVQQKVFLSIVNVDIVGQTMLKLCVPLCRLFYLFCEPEFKISKKPKDYKGILIESGVDCSFVGIDIIQKEYIMEIWKIDLMEFDPRWRLLKSVPNF